MRLKVHHLTNLQDARAAAAWGAHYLGLVMERGNPYKLPDRTVEAFLEWLAGSFVVIQLGDDLAALDALTPWLREHRLWVELNGSTAAEHLATDRLQVPVPFGLVSDIPGLETVPSSLLAEAQYLDLQLPEKEPTAADLTRIRSRLPQGLPLLLRADALLPARAASLLQQVDGLSLGRHLPDAFGQLDYDAIETLLPLLHPLD